MSSELDDLKDIKKFFFEKLSRDVDGEVVPALDTLNAVATYFDQAVGLEVHGTGAANGDNICNLTIAAGALFIVTRLSFATNVSALARVGTGTLGTMTDYDFVDCQAIGEQTKLADGSVPLCIIDNTGGTALVLRMYAPLTAYGIGTNNDAFHYFNGFIGGIELS